MKITEALKGELAQWLEIFWTTYIKGDYDRWSTFITEDYYNIGGTKEEIWHSKQEILNYSYAMQDQMVGQAEIRNREIEVLPYGDYLMVNEFTDLFVKIEGEWTYYGPFRMSSLLSKTDTGWVALHQHGSYPDMKAAEGEAFAADVLKAENKRLQEAVDQRTTELLLKNRELEIEAALEKVRSRSLAMHATSELQEVIHAVHQELIKLDIGIFGGSFIAINSEIEEELHCWGAGGTADTSDEVHIPYFDKPFYTNLVKRLKGGPSFFTEEFTHEEKKAFFTFLFTKEPWSNLKANEKKEILSSPGGYTRSCSVSFHTSIFIINQLGNKFSEEENYILKRFGKVFEQSYTRFLDLQKAEAQAKEAQIEVAIERVRAQSMAMHHPDDLDKVNKELLSQLKWLQIQGLTGVTFYLIDEKGWVKAWDFSSPGNTADQSSYTLQFDSNKHEMLGLPFKTLLQTDLDYFVADYPLEKLEKAVYEFDEIDPAMAKIVREALSTGILTHQWTACCRISNGLLGIDLVSPPSEDTKAIVLKMAGAFNQAYTRFLDLQKAEAQAREAEIELALERVRARTMAMHSSSELLEVATVLFQQVKALGVPQWNCGFNIWEKGDTEFTYYPGSPDGIIFPSPCKIPLEEHPIFRKFNESRNRGEELLIYEKEGEIQADHYAYMLSLPGVGDLLQSMLDAGFELPTFQIDHIANFAYGNLIFITYQHYPEMHEVFKRFAKVFEQTYTRFLDLQRAEAQAREAQIEAALERIRSRSLAMYKTDDLREVVAVLFEQMQGLSVDMGFASVSIFIFEQDSRNITQWIPTSLGVSALSIPYFDHPISSELFDAKENGADYFAKIYTLEEKNSWLEAGFELTDYKDLPDDFKASLIEAPGYAISITLAKSSGICIPSFVGTLPSADDVAIMKRVGKVFEQAYIRFLDLQKAESQAREAQIEATLERVRSRSMGMQNSSELKDVIQVVYQQFISLGIPIAHTGFIMDYKDREDMNIWLADSNQFHSEITFPYFDSPHWNSYLKAKEKGENFFINQLDFDTKNTFYQDLFALIPDLPKETQDFYFAQDGLSISTVLLDNVGLYIENYTTTPFTDEENQVLMRFGKVFQQTYTRFLDLQKAEARALESQIETALERVRSRTMGMQQSEELGDVATVLFNEMNGLVDDLWTCGFVLCEENRQEDEWWLSMDTGFTRGFFLPNVGDFAHETLYEGWKKRESFRSVELEGKMLNDHYEWLMKVPIAKQIFADMEASGIPRPKWQKLHAAYFKTGYLVIITEVPCAEEEIFKRFAQVFDLTYTRFLDLQQKEEQGKKLVEEKLRLELTLKDLQATQAQLIQAEKMASLGELTAGIAHEIQNPLNFVNNFAEVSGELVDEMNEELEKGDIEEAKAIGKDLKENLSKINHHGKRADAIVKGMLEHSRANKGEKAPTDLNALADEFVRLSYHGLRAKDKSFNADFKLELDPNLPKVNVVASDIGRVILNLVNNGFYAVNEKAKSTPQPSRNIGTGFQGEEGYKPEVVVKTTLIKSTSGDLGVQISVQDNGPGIPDHIKEKIFQPFFTTKPTGSGTGLGLSLSYDIVKAHGGELEIETSVNKGTTFIIKLSK